MTGLHASDTDSMQMENDLRDSLRRLLADHCSTEFLAAWCDGARTTAPELWRELSVMGIPGLPVREEVIMAAEESAQFRRWSAATNVDDDVLDQMTADVAELARREQIDPPAASFSRLLGARDDVFTP